MRNFKDESFIGQFLSPKLMRDFRLFADPRRRGRIRTARSSAIHDDSGYRRLRESLSRQYDLSRREPNIQVWNVNLRGDRSLTLRHTQHNDRPLHDERARSAQARGAPRGASTCGWRASTARAGVTYAHSAGRAAGGLGRRVGRP